MAVNPRPAGWYDPAFPLCVGERPWTTDLTVHGDATCPHTLLLCTIGERIQCENADKAGGVALNHSNAGACVLYRIRDFLREHPGVCPRDRECGEYAGQRLGAFALRPQLAGSKNVQNRCSKSVDKKQ